MDIKDVLRRYADIKLQIKALEDEAEEMKPQIVEYMAKEGVDKLPTSAGNFTVSETSRWKFSPAVEKLQEEEKQKGIAKKVVITMLKFTAKKNEEQ